MSCFNELVEKKIKSSWVILKPFKNEEWQIETIIKMTVRLPLTHLTLTYTIKLFTLVVVNKLVRFPFTFQV